MRLRINKPGWFLILVGTLVWSITMVKSGLVYSFGMGFWGPNGHDGVWHLALINSLARGSFDMPTYAGSVLQNYHIGFDLLLAWVHKLTRIPSVTLYFQILPVLFALLIGFLAYKLVYLWKGSTTQAWWATFFVYFGGSWGWVFSFLRNGDAGSESMFWSQQSISTLVNPPFAFSLVLMLTGLILLIKLSEKLTTYYLLLAILCFSLLSEVKVYGGILGLGALGVVSTIQLLKHKKITYFAIFGVSVLISAILFFPLNRGSSNLVVFQPFWFLETMMALSDRFGWQKFYDAMTTYKMGHIWFKAIPAYIVAFLIFWFGNMGTRGIKELLVWRWIKNLRKITMVEIFMSVIIVFGGIFPMFFLQKGTPWNTIQFFYYSLIFSGILAGVSLGNLIESKSMPHISVFVTRVSLLPLLVVVLTLPTTLGTLMQYLPARPPAKISTAELDALNFLSKQQEGVVLTYPFDREAALAAEANPPRPLYLYESTAYVSAFADKPVYLEDEVNLDITDYDWETRRGDVVEFLNSLDQRQVSSFLRDNSIKYVYWVKGQRATLGESQLGISRIFENKEVDIYQVN